MRHDVKPTARLVWHDFIIYAVLQGLRIGTDRLLPPRLLDPQGWRYRPRRWERGGAIYEEVFHISRWKDKLPSVDGFNKTSKTHLGAPTAEHLDAVIVETCRGESHHWRSIWETAFFALWNPPSVFWPEFLLSAIGHAPFVMIQRYNRPRLQRLRDARARHEQAVARRAAQAEKDAAAAPPASEAAVEQSSTEASVGTHRASNEG